MEIVCRCQCGTQFKVAAKYAGKKAKCPKCQQVTVVPSVDPSQLPPAGTPSSPNVLPPSGSTEPKKPRFQDAAATQASITQPDFADIQAPKTPTTPASNSSAASSASAPSILPPGKMSVTARMRAGATGGSSSPTINLQVESPSPAEAAKARTAKRNATPNLQYIVGGGVALALLVVLGIGFAVYSFSGKASPTLLVLNWPESERRSVKLELDRKLITVPMSGPIELKVTPGTHRITVQRRGFEMIDYGFTVQQGQRFNYTPNWTPSLLASSQPNTVVQTPATTNSPPAAVDPRFAQNTSPETGTEPLFPKSGTTPPNSSGSGSTIGKRVDNDDNLPAPQGFAGWLQLIDMAKRRAADKKLDIFLVFSGSDWAQPSVEMTNKLFSSPEFLEYAKQRFVLLVVDDPRKEAGFNLLTDPAQNNFLKWQFGVQRVPSVFLLDSNGLPYASHGYFEKDVSEYLKLLNEQQILHGLRDELIKKSRQEANLEERLKVAEESLKFLRSQKAPAGNSQRRTFEDLVENHFQLGIARFYTSQLTQWLNLSKNLNQDAPNEKTELFFESDWAARLITTRDNNKRMQVVGELKDWPASRFIDQDRGTKIYLIAGITAQISGLLNEVDTAFTEVTKFSPQSPELREMVQQLTKALKQKDRLGSGTGFVIGNSGHLLTNFHVISGPGKIVIRVPGTEAQVPATMVAVDSERDIALLKFDPEQLPNLKPIKIVDSPVNRGSRVAVFGFPLGDEIGGGVKLTTGVVSALPDQATDQMLLIDNKVNPGNSGGPLCNSIGNVIGMVTAKSQAGDGLDSYGMAIPAKDLQAFLVKHLPNFEPESAPKITKNLEWDEVDQMVSPAVLMILKVK